MAVAGLLTGGCKARVCKAWAGWDIPQLKSVDTCYGGELAGTTAATEAAFKRPFEERGLARGYPASARLGEKDPWTYMFKAGEPHQYKFSFHPGKEKSEFVLSESATQSDMLSEADLKQVVTLPEDEAAYDQRLANLDVPRLFDAADKAPARCTDEDIVSREPGIASRSTFVMLNVDALANKGEKRRGIPGNYEARSQEALGKEALGSLLRERRSFDQRVAMRIVPAFRVTAYREPSKRGSEAAGINVGLKGEVQIAIAAIDLKEKRVLCRTSARATNSGSFKGTADGDAFAADLRDNLEAAAVVAIRAANPKLAPETAPVAP